MLGYVFDGKIDKALSGINKSVRNRAKDLRMKPPGGLARSKIFAEKPIHETGHDLTRRYLVIYHVLVGV
jgi:hypothetical protein